MYVTIMCTVLASTMLGFGLVSLSYDPYLLLLYGTKPPTHPLPRYLPKVVSILETNPDLFVKMVAVAAPKGSAKSSAKSSVKQAASAASYSAVIKAVVTPAASPAP